MGRQIATIRTHRPSDLAYVWEHWAREFGRGQNLGPRYLPEMKAHMARVAAWPETELRIAAVPDEDDGIHGWAVVSHVTTMVPRIHFVYSRPSSRRLGVATMLLADLADRPCVYTAKPAGCSSSRLSAATRCTWSAAKSTCFACVLPRPEQWTFSPFGAYYPGP